MALAPLRLRRAVALSSSLLRESRLSSAAASSPHPVPPIPAAGGGFSLPVGSPGIRRSHSLIQSLAYRSSAHLESSRYGGGGSGDNISPDEILFEGCDYNHWLITMDFPKDPAPTREEMIETYIQTLAKVVGSVEEAKKRMYALSTTTYHGFQAVMTEEMSEKFRGLPGVVFILPDSYIDPVNKEYGGDKYENGVITPRPPPIQYGRQTRGRNTNRYDRGNYNSPPPQGNQPNYQQQGSRQGDGWRSPQQNYNQPGQYGRVSHAPGGRDFVHAGQRGDFRQGDVRSFEQSSVREGHQGERREPMPSYQTNFNQGDQGNFAPQGQRNFGRGPGGENMYENPSSYDNNRQGSGPGYTQDYRQGSGPGYTQDYRQGSGPGYTQDYRQETRPGYNDGQGMNSNYGSDNRGSGAGYGGSYQQESGSTNGQHSGPTEGHHGSWQ